MLKMEEARATNKIEIKTNLSKEKIEFINSAYTEEIDYWKRAAFRGKNEEEKKHLTNLPPSRGFFWLVKTLGKDCAENINGIIFYLKKNYSNHNREQVRIDIPQDICSISFEEMPNRIKTYSKSIIDVENTTLKNKAAFEAAFGKALPNRFEDWIQREYGVKNKQSTIIKNCISWQTLLQSYLTVELIQLVLLKTKIFLLITFKTTTHRGIMLLTAVVKIAIYTLGSQNVLWHLEAMLK